MIDSKRMTANNLEAKPTTHAIASTINTINDLDPAGFIIPEDPLPTATDVVAISLEFNCLFFSNDGWAQILICLETFLAKFLKYIKNLYQVFEYFSLSS